MTMLHLDLPCHKWPKLGEIESVDHQMQYLLVVVVRPRLRACCIEFVRERRFQEVG